MTSPLTALRASFVPSVRLRRRAGAVLSVSGAGSVLKLAGVGRGTEAAVRRLRGAGAPIDALSAIASDYGGVEDASGWLYVLRALERAGLVCYTVVSNAKALARLVPISPYYAAEIVPVSAHRRLTLSRFALARRSDTGPGWILESPLALARIDLLHPNAIAWLAALGAPVTLAALVRDTPRRDRAAQQAFVALLSSAGFLTRPSSAAWHEEDRSADLAPWEFTDALMHARSRRGRHDNLYGRVFPFRGRLRPLPRTKPPMSADVTLLSPANLTALRRHDLSFSRVLESRRSVRAHGGRPINVRQLGEFLYRAARVQATLQPKPPVRPYDASLRPSPSGGACHELELYVVVNRCSGLARGVYHYDPLRHALGRLDAGLDALDALLQDCPAPQNAPAPWHVLIVITARFGRVSWKYRGMSYATILKDVGALMQTMYLVGTAMHLAPCALGGGDSERFARTIGTNYFAESSVGEFLIGTRAATRAARRR